jgi:hypothetical protein
MIGGETGRHLGTLGNGAVARQVRLRLALAQGGCERVEEAPKIVVGRVEVG